MSRLFRASCLVAVVTAGLAMHHAPAASASRTADDWATIRSAREAMLHQSARQVASSLLPYPDGMAVHAAHGTLYLTFGDGISAAIAPRARGMQVHLSPYGAQSPRQTAAGGRAVVLEPFAFEFNTEPSTGLPSPEINELQQAGFQVDALYDQDVTVNVMAGLTKYNIIYMETHSGINPGGDAAVATGQKVGTNDTGISQFVQDGSVVTVRVSTSNGQSSDQYYAIDAAFVTNHLGQFPSHSLLFLNGCSVLSAPTFWQALQAKGMSTLVSWDKEATFMDNYLAGAAFFHEMDAGLDVQTAIKSVQAAGYGRSTTTDGSNNQITATLGYLGDGSLTLGKSSQGQVSTIVPPPPPATAVPTTRPTSTPTPAPTMTPTSTPTLVPVQLTVQLKQRVNPGSRQVLTITSKPNTVIHIHIAFPNGDSRNATTATDESGQARYSFVQRSNEVTYQSAYATVEVQALGTAPNTFTAKYLIGWSRIDLNVTPAVQSVGQKVNFWVHTAAHTRVTIRLQFPSGKTKQLHGYTGKGGWAHLHYIIGNYLTHGDDHLVQVTAQAQVNGALVQTNSAFRIS